MKLHYNFYHLTYGKHLNFDKEIWPKDLPVIPNVGDLIQSAKKYEKGQLVLQVSSVTWKEFVEIEYHQEDGYGDDEKEIRYWGPEIEFSWYPKEHGTSFKNFIDYYVSLQGKSK